MKILARLSVAPESVDQALMAKLRAVFPDQSAPSGFVLTGDLQDDRLQGVLELLREVGLQAWDFNQGRAFDRTSEYLLNYERIYDAEDLSACEYLQVDPPSKAVHMEASTRSGAGKIVLPKYKMPRGFDIMITWLRNAYFVTDRAKAVLEGASLENVTFLPAVYGPSRLEPGESEEMVEARFGRPYWEMESDCTLPPLSPAMRFKDSGGRPWSRGDYSNGLHACEDLFLRPELHYRQSDLDALPAFDLARTLEPFGNYRSYDRHRCPLVASRRFYETCMGANLKTGWMPVRIDRG